MVNITSGQLWEHKQTGETVTVCGLVGYPNRTPMALRWTGDDLRECGSSVDVFIETFRPS